MKATFEHSVNVLVKAYLNDTLEHENCCACAVGNLVADGLNKSFIANDNIEGSDCKIKWDSGNYFASPFRGWPQVFMTEIEDGNPKQRIKKFYYHNDTEAKQQIDSTGYTWQQLAKIEYAFEAAEKGSSEDDWMFNGLMAVVDVLAEIHGVDLEKKEEAKAMFKKCGEELELKKA